MVDKSEKDYMNYKPLKIFQIGSSLFFKNYSDYIEKDNDLLYIMDNIWGKYNIYKMQIGKDDIFMCRNMSKEDFVNDTIISKVNMRAGKFLNPEFAKYIGMTIEDLKKLKEMFYNMDEKHSYEKIIYDSYIENGDFSFSKEQLDKAYKEYKRVR